ncbi:hypothetical protein DM860_017729 [Cuscuta australis]|uniref:Pentacotripeptide-repeat region of PRORP domain-containing protein n=1 Tax=Cuscuta australis TaxID=267555 RepID=A0A328D7P9_9ASTE|nr:hypothetical protein DM860_017729 [Cuscuta australis]
MIRAKQIGTLSQSARSLILNGSRSGAADGSCACSEDDTRASRRIQTKKDAERREASSSSFTKPTGGVDSSISRDAIKALSSQKNEKCEYSVSQPKVAPYSNPSKRADCVSSYGSLEASDGLHSSPPISDQFVRAGIAAVNFLSDLVHYKIPMSDGAIKSSPDCIVEHTEPFSTPKPSSTAKSFGKDYAKTPPAVTSSPVNSCSGTPGRGSKCNSVTNDGTAVDVDTHDKRMTLCANSRPYYSTCDDQASNGELIIKERPKRLSLRETKNGNHTADTVSRVLQQHMHWGPETEDALSKLNRPLDAYQANQVLKRLQNHALALNYFYWLKCQPGFKHDEHTYTTMVGILGRAKQFGAINRLISQMVAEGCQPNVVTYNRIIHSYGRANYLNESLRVFNRMQEEGCEPDRVTYCTLIDLHAKAGYLDVAMDMYQRMQEAGLSPDTFTYSVIINCLGKAGHLVTAHKLFCEMVNQGCVPNLVTYNIMIALHSKARNYSHALQLYRDMQEAGFQPDKVTYSIIMEVFGHCGYLHEAEEVFMEMTRNNWAPDEPVYGLLVDLWGKAGNVKKAWEWYHAMLCAGLRPNVPTCNSLLSTFLRVHQLPDAYNLLQSMITLGLNPSLQTYTLLLSCCTEARATRRVERAGPRHPFLGFHAQRGPGEQEGARGRRGRLPAQIRTQGGGGVRVGGGRNEEHIPGRGEGEELVLLAHQPPRHVRRDRRHGTVEDAGVVPPADTGAGHPPEPDRHSDGVGAEEQGDGDVAGEASGAGVARRVWFSVDQGEGELWVFCGNVNQFRGLIGAWDWDGAPLSAPEFQMDALLNLAADKIVSMDAGALLRPKPPSTGDEAVVRSCPLRRASGDTPTSYPGEDPANAREH